jgi:type II secretory pathway pseudopilin PulG
VYRTGAAVRYTSHVMAMRNAGYSLIELLFVLGVAATASGIAIPPLLRALDDYRTAGAVHYISTRIQRTRLEAVSRSAYVAMQFTHGASAYSFGVYLDGDGDGVLTSDIQSGIDRRLADVERLPDNFAGVDFGVLPGLPPVDPGGASLGTDPIRLGSGNLLSYSPIGSSSPGSLYVRGRGAAQYVIRILGDTGRVRVLSFDTRTREWRHR